LVRDGIVQLFCPKSNPPVQRALYFEKKGDLKKFWDSQTHGLAGPQKLA
jgi:hypothetical protein